MNINAINEYNRAPGIGLQTKNEDNRADIVAGAFEEVFISSAKSMKSTDVARKSISGISESVAAIEEALKADAQVAKDNLKALFNKLTGPEAAAMDEDGWNLNDMDSEEILTVVDRIKIMLATYCENYQVMSGEVDQEQIAEVIGNPALAAKITQKLAGTYVPTTTDNVKEVDQTLKMASKLPKKLDDKTLANLMKNGKEPTVADIYKACHTSGEVTVQPLSDEQLGQLMPQIDRIIEKSGLEVNEGHRESAAWLIEHQVELNPENLVKLDSLQKFEFTYDEDVMIEKCADAMSDGKSAKDVLLIGDGDAQWKQISEAIDILNRADAKAVEAVTAEYGSLTISRLSFSMTSIEGYMAANYSVEVSSAIVTNNRILNEARLMLTAYSGKVLMNSGIDIFNEDLKNIAELLHESQVKYVIDDFSDKNAGSISQDDLNKVSDFQDKLNALRFMPSAAIGRVMMAGVSVSGTISSTVSISTSTIISESKDGSVTASAATTTSITESSVSVMELYQEGNALRYQYEQAGVAYDTMSTTVRSDMGDNIKKAVEASAESILKELGLEDTRENRRSINILASNSMEMTIENVFAVKEKDVVLNNIMQQISPDTVLKMIRDNINPLEADISILNDYIQNRQANVTDEVEKFSEFLYVLDRNGEITPQEREKFIGVYKMFNMFKKDAGKAIGALVNQGAEITMGNLVTAINSRKKYDMDISLDTNEGMAEIVGKTAYFHTLFSSLGRKITPELLKKASDSNSGGDFESLSLEKFEELVQEAEKEKEVRAQYYSEELERMQAYTDMEDSVMRMLTDFELPVTFHHLMAADGLNKRFGELFDDIWESGVAGEESMDSEAASDEVADGIRYALEELTESLESEESMNMAYQKLESSVDESVRKMLAGEDDKKLDLNRLRYMTESVRMMGTLSQRHDYIIPFETEDGTAMLNIKLVSDDAEHGKIQINMINANEEQMYLECNIRDNKLDIFVVENIEAFEESQLTAGLESFGFEEIKVNILRNDIVPAGAGSSKAKTPTTLLYRTAKVLVKNLMKTESN